MSRNAAVSLWSRQGKNLTAHFPDLADAAAVQIPKDFVIDGEVVTRNGGRGLSLLTDVRS